MRIEAIAVQNFLGLPDFRHALSKPLLFIAGPNGAGKTSLQDALRFALTGELPRGVTKVSDRDRLITEGAAAGFVQVKFDGYELRRAIGSGKVTGDTPELPAAVGLCLDAPRFATLPEAERRRWLFDLSGVKVDRQGIAEMLAAACIDEPVIERVLPQLRDGFPAAAAYAKEQAAQARGAWRAITGEAYGSQKGETWSPPMPDNQPTDAEVEEQRSLMAACEQRVQVMAEAKGRVGGAVSAQRREALASQASVIPQLELDLQAAEDVVVDARLNLDALTPAMERPALECPDCHARLMLANGALTHAPETPKKAPSREVTAAQRALTDATAKRDDIKAALQAAYGAKGALENLPDPPSDEDVSAASMLDQEQGNLRLFRATLDSLQRARDLADAARGKEERAKEEHRKVAAWVAAEAQLGPDGIPATLLARALDPINDALAAQASVAGFRPARIERDLSLTYAGRAYGLCSESERWRADALFAVVVAMMSGVRLVALDRFDVLDPASRGQALDWLEALTFQPEVDTVVITGTLKAKPDLGEGVDVVWLEGAALPAAA